MAVPLSLDRWLSGAAVRTRHRRMARAAPDALWAAAREVRLSDTAALGRVVRWRIPGLAPDLRYRDLFASYPFVLLDEGDGWSVSGLCGRIWTLRRDYPRLRDAADFLGWDAPGTVRVVMAHWVEESRGGRSALVSEARVAPTDRAAAFRLRVAWTAVRPFERLIGAEPLALAARRAEPG